MADERPDRAGGLGLVVFTLITWLMVLMLQGCAGSGFADTSYDRVMSAAMTFCTEQCLPFGVLDAAPAPSDDGTSPFRCECMPAGIEMPEEEPEKKPEDDPDERCVAAVID
jgi:hypothetical protein